MGNLGMEMSIVEAKKTLNKTVTLKIDCSVEKFNQETTAREAILRIEIKCFENGSLIEHTNFENNSGDKPTDKPPKRKTPRMKLWQKREAMLKGTPLL